ncbi:glycine cleavage system aminomethyltransferase GcvT [Gammaproteobacteria bacterium]|nr:glycine cleavage system aminomethyltransferase GcvT [Gammaproteobacteria bacterium]
MTIDDTSRLTPLHALHLELGARMVPFAGYSMPLQYRDGILAEHRHVRESAGLFDVSHMGQIMVRGPGCGEALEAILPADLIDMPVGRQQYSFLLDEQGGIIDDLIVTRQDADCYGVVVNAANRESDLLRIKANLPDALDCQLLQRSLVAIQGPGARAAMSRLNPGIAELRFMNGAEFELLGETCWISASGYTGEDGFEISLADGQAEAFVRRVLEDISVRPIGLGARDSLRLEAGLCLSGHDIHSGVTPLQARLGWAIGKARRPGGERAGGYVGAAAIDAERAEGASRLRVGLKPDGRAPIREGTTLFAGDDAIGEVTSGGFGASVGGPVAMGYVSREQTPIGTRLEAEVRGKRQPLEVVALPFTPYRYYR